MKYIAFIFFIAITFVRCKSDPKKERLEILKKSLDTISFNDTYSYEDYKMFIVENNKTITSRELCEIDSIKAQMDIEKNKLTFFSRHAQNRPIESLEKMPEILKEEYDINTVELLPGCLINDSTEYGKCYERLMQKAINKKYGNNFLDKVKRTADSIYLHENRNKIYSSKNSYAMFQRLISDDYQNWRDSIRRSLFDKMAFPKDNPMKKDGSAGFIIKGNGTIDSLDVYTYNSIEKNHLSYEEQIKKQMENLIRKTNWLPFETYGIKLKTKEHFFFTEH